MSDSEERESWKLYTTYVAIPVTLYERMQILGAPFTNMV